MQKWYINCRVDCSRDGCYWQMTWGLSETRLTGKGKAIKSKWVEKFENRLREEEIIW